MTNHVNKKKALVELQLVEGKSNPTPLEKTGRRTVFSIQHTADTRTARHALHDRQRAAVLTTLAVLLALGVALAQSPLVTDVAMFVVALVITRLRVVKRRRGRRAAQRAEVWERIATTDALVVGNAHALDGQVAA